MKKIYTIIFAIVLISCEDSVAPVYDIYNEWQWVKTTFDTRGKPITAQEVDSTYYVTFTQNGKLIVKNNNKVTIDEYDIIVEEGDNFDSYKIKTEDAIFGYKIKSDSLFIWQSNSIWPQTNIYKISK